MFSDKEQQKLRFLEDTLPAPIVAEPLPRESLLRNPPVEPEMATLQIDGGRKQKVRPGDILGALTGKQGVAGKDVGKIQIFDNCAYVAVKLDALRPALKKLGEGKLKGRNFRVRHLRH